MNPSNASVLPTPLHLPQGPQGQDLQTLRRHHVGRGVLVGGWFYALNASAPLERWEELQGQLRNIVGSFRC